MAWMTYEDAAKAIGIKPASVKRQARAKGWPRRVGNDGKAMIDLPTDRLADRPPAILPPDKSAPPLLDESPRHATRIAALEASLAAAEKRAGEIAEDRDAWKTMAEALRADLAAERSAGRHGWLARLLGSKT